jgi:hypothetical protein
MLIEKENCIINIDFFRGMNAGREVCVLKNPKHHTVARKIN